MLLDIVKKGSTDRSVILRIIDSSDGTPETGVVYNTSGIALWYRREGAAKTSITEATLSALTDAHSDGGVLHVGDGYYRLDLPDAAFATSAQYVDVGGTVTGMVVIGGRVRLVDIDIEVANIPANVLQFGSSNGTFSGGRPEVNTSHIAGSAVSTSTAQLGVNVVNFGGSAGTFASGRPEVNASHIAGSAVSTSAAQIGVNVVNAAGTAWNSGAIGASTLASDTITAAKIAADAIGASELAADAVTEIQSGLATSSALSTLQTDVTTLLGRITSGLFTGITSLAQWLGLLAGKQTGNSTARTEVRATGAGSGTYDETTDSQEALRDNVGTNGAALSLAKTTNITGFNDLSAAQVNAEADTALADVGVTSTVTGRVDVAVSTRLATSGYTAPLDAAGTRTALGMASANLDTQLTAIDDYLDTEIAAIKAVTDQLVAAQSEPSSVPAANATPLAKIAWLAALARNRVEQTATTQTLKADDGTTTIATATVSDDGSQFVRGEFS